MRSTQLRRPVPADEPVASADPAGRSRPLCKNAFVSSQDEVTQLRDRYLDLLIDALLHVNYRPIDVGARSKATRSSVEHGELEDLEVRLLGKDWPIYGQSMSGISRLRNVRYCAETVLREDIPGDLIETGVWRGASTILMRAVIAAYGNPQDRYVYVADSFEGLPEGDVERYAADAAIAPLLRRDTIREPGALDPALLAVSVDEVRRNFELYGLLDERVRFVEGWFRNTLPPLQGHPWSIMRLDGDMYESTINALENLYPSLSPGGFCIIDDYSIGPCREAVDHYRLSHGIDEPIEEIDWTGVYWRRRVG